MLLAWRQVRIIFKMERKKKNPQKTTPNKPAIALNLNETGDLVSFHTHKVYKFAMHPCIQHILEFFTGAMPGS